MRPGDYVLRLAAVFGILIFSGCGDSGPQTPKCYPVSGAVLVKGKPAVRALVSFHPEAPQDDGKKYVAQTSTDDDGEFRMTTFTAGDGVPPGKYIVTIVANWVSSKGEDVAVDDLLGGKYATPEKSTLKVTVEEELLELDPFSL